MIELFPSREIFLTIGSVSLHWYGLMYFLGFMLGGWLVPHVQRYRGLTLTRSQVDMLIVYVVLGVIVGGRLGYVLFWQPEFYVERPLLIFAVWQGGMSSHGGMIGTALAAALFCAKNKISFLRLADICMPLFALGIALGRLGNFINLELYGTVTDVPWAIAIPGVEGLRHPTQIYSFLTNMSVFAITLLYVKHTAEKNRVGGVLGLFFVLYAVQRYAVEYFRDQSGYGYYDILGMQWTYGQLLTIPVFLLGVLILFLVYRKRA